MRMSKEDVVKLVLSMPDDIIFEVDWKNDYLFTPTRKFMKIVSSSVPVTIDNQEV